MSTEHVRTEYGNCIARCPGCEAAGETPMSFSELKEWLGDVLRREGRALADLSAAQARITELEAAVKVLNSFDARSDVLARRLAAARAENAKLREALRTAVNAECECSGRGADDPMRCLACAVWHRWRALTTEGEPRK